MNKEELLKRSRQDNSQGDEREKQIRIQAQNHGLIIVNLILIVCGSLSYFQIISGEISILGRSMSLGVFCFGVVFVGNAIEYTIECIQLLNRKKLLQAILCWVLVILILLKFLS